MYRNIRQLCCAWSTISYRDQLIHISELSSSCIPLCEIAGEELEELGILDSNMTGNTVENLPRNERVEQKGTIHGISFTNIYHSCLEEYYFSPALYLVKMVQVLKDKNVSSSEHLGWLSRSLRAFPSFLRETDYAIQLLDILCKFDAFVTINSNPEQDVKKHIDILLNYYGKQYYIWSYLNTPNSIHNLKKRLLCESNRPELPNGIHLFSPIDLDITKTDNIGGWVLAKHSEVERFCYFINHVYRGLQFCSDYNAVREWLIVNYKNIDELKRAFGEFRVIKK